MRIEGLRRICWVASYPKSGNTWVRALLSSYLSGTSVDINKMTYADIDDTRAPYSDVIKDLGPETSFLEVALARPAALVGLIKHAADTTSNILVKTHFCRTRLFGIDMVPYVLTRSAIYIVRDPRDVVASYAAHFQTPIDAAIERLSSPHGTIKQHDVDWPNWSVLGSWSSHVRSWTTTESKYPTMVVRYEDLKHSTKATFKAILEFLGMPVDPTRINKAVKASSFDRLVTQERVDGFRERQHDGSPFFRRGVVGSWQSELTEEQAQRVVDAHKIVMAELGYLR